ncbi:MAG: efflux RND transporter permease subunit [bacterium]|nr:efflux RND transporter permease subunit [bacterium]
MKIVEFSIKRRVTVSMAVVVIVILGFTSFSKLGLDLFPDMEAPFISVVTNYSGVTSEDIEQNITRPLEQWISTVSRVKEIKSISQEGISIISVEFESDANLDFAAQDIRDKIGLFENFLPEEADNPLVVKFNFADFPIMMYGISGGNKNLKQLKEYVDNEIAVRLERLEGVASVIVFSPEYAEILIDVDKGKLESRGLSITNVERAIQASNINLPSGYLDINHTEYLIRTKGQFEKGAEIKDIVVGIGKRGEPIFLKDIADVRETSKEVRNNIRINGTKGVMMMITKSSRANTVLTAREVKKKMKAIIPSLDKDLKFNISFDMARFIEIMSVKNAYNVLLGGMLAMFLIFLFLRSIRPTLAVGFAIPLSVIATFIALYLAGYTLNLITLAGLALGVGMLVDNSIVVIENISRHLEEGKTPYEAAYTGTSEVGTAITASTLTTIAVFFPMMFASGTAGKLSRGLAVTVAFALLSSLFIALTIIPMMASWFFKIKIRSKKKKEKIAGLGMEKFTRLRSLYEKYLNIALKKRKTVLFAVIFLFIAAIVLALFLGSEFMPVSDQNMIFLKLRMPVGTNLAETDRVITYVEKQSLDDKNVLSTMVSVGINEQNAQDSASGFNPAGSYEATLWAYLKTSSKRNISDKEILEQWRQFFPGLEKGKIQFVDLSSSMGMGGGSTSPIEFSFFGRDLDTLGRIAERVKEKISGIEGIRDVEISLERKKPEIQLHIKKEEASKLGLTAYDISHQVQTYTIGTVVSRVMMEGEERDIRVRLNEKDRDSLEALKKLPIVTPSGSKTYLSQAAVFRHALGAVKIQRENQVRKVSVTANYIGRDLGGIVAEILEKAADITANLPEGYFHEMGGQYKEMLESFETMLLALLLSIVLVYAVMASQFENLKFPFIIMFTIPLAFIGVVALLAVTGKNISLVTFMGFIMLSGIVVNNGIVMVDYINQLVRGGMDRYDAVVKGAAVRLRPILITALSTIFGMLPMAISTTEGSEMRSPMAIALIGGLLASTFLTLFVVPILYTVFSKIRAGVEKRI